MLGMKQLAEGLRTNLEELRYLLRRPIASFMLQANAPHYWTLLKIAAFIHRKATYLISGIRSSCPALPLTLIGGGAFSNVAVVRLPGTLHEITPTLLFIHGLSRFPIGSLVAR